MPLITVKGTDIHYRQGRGEEKNPLVLIHGSGGSSENWPQEIFDTDTFRTIAPDLPGHGLSKGSPASDMDTYIRFACDFIQALGLSKTALGGHSLGGGVTLGCALMQPEWLTKIILVGTGARLRVSPLILDSLKNDFEAAISVMDQVLFGPDAPEELKQDYRATARTADPKVLLADFTACDHFDVLKELSQIRIPALVVSATHDQLTPLKYGQFLADTLPDARIAVLEGAGHLMALEKAGEFAGALKDFLL